MTNNKLPTPNPFLWAPSSIHAKNPKGEQSGVKKLPVDGRKIMGNILTVRPPRYEPVCAEIVLEG